MNASRSLRICAALATIAAIALALVAAALTIRASYCAFTWGKFTLVDYGRYVNMVWNSGHGRGFTVLVDGTYLSTHMSFTLALLGPFFRIWDHPFLLAVLQWLSMVLGAVTLAASAARRLPGEVAAALAMFFVANPYTQAVMLCEFHGVALYFVLIPWLYVCLSRPTKSGVWLPYLLLAGVREEAALIAVPMLAYFAIRDRWRAGWLLAAAAGLWALVAMQVLFPWLGGVRFEARAAHVFNVRHYLNLLSFGEIRQRALPFLPCALVAVPFLFRGGWRPILVFPLVAALMAATAPMPNMFLLLYHYPAAIIVLLSLALVEASKVRAHAGASRVSLLGLAVFLIAATIAWHRVAGFLPGGGQYDRIYGLVHPRGEEALEIARTIPKEGVLLCPGDLAGFVANRDDLLTWESLEPRHHVDLVFARLAASGRYREKYREMLESGEFGVRTIDRGGYAVLERGYATERNDEVIRAYLSEPASRRATS